MIISKIDTTKFSSVQIKNYIKESFKDLKFEPIKHVYSVNGIIYPSVSSKINAHAPKFDKKAILPWSAKKAGVSEEFLGKKWDDTRDAACALGHETHDYLEHYNGYRKPSTEQQKAGEQFILDILKHYIIIDREPQMYSRQWGYAGTSDLLLGHRITRELVLCDYKTNKDLFKLYNNQTLFKPFDFLDATPYNKYQLQLSYYQIMLEGIGLKISNRMIVYLKNDATYIPLYTEDYTKELKQYMKIK